MRYDFVTPQEAELMDKALKCIETVAEEEALRLLDNPRKRKIWDLIYRLAHGGRSPSCQNSHPDWEKEIEKLHEALR